MSQNGSDGVAASETEGDHWSAMRASLRAGRHRAAAGDAAAMPAFERALANARLVDDSGQSVYSRYLVDALCHLGAATCRFGDAGAGLDLYREAREIAVTRGEGFLAAGVLMARAQTLTGMMRTEAARDDARLAAEEFEHLGYAVVAQQCRDML